MRKLSILVVGCMVAAMSPQASVAQPGPYGNPGRQPPPSYAGHPGQPPQSGGQYYYNGRWVDQNEWQRHGAERDRWARNYQQRKGHDNSTAVIAGILGFALGAAIVGSQQQAEKARTADQSWDTYCARKYRSYDPRSRTYLGNDGLRHYCQ
jgi:hypothetical protein